MSRRHLDYPEWAQPDPEAPEVTILVAKGVEHEHAVFNQLRAEGRDIGTVPQSGDRAVLTMAAIQAGYPIIYQGELAHGAFAVKANCRILAGGRKHRKKHHVPWRPRHENH